MLTSQRLLVLLMISGTILAGCGNDSDNNDPPANATFGSAAFGSATWE